MTPATGIRHEFVEFIPAKREEDVLYVSIPFATCVHSCFCGCGTKVVTPLSPVGWQLFFDGETVSLTPSVGNWSFDCQSHYWVERNSVRWAAGWSRQQIEDNRLRDQSAKERYYGVDGRGPVSLETKSVKTRSRQGLLSRFSKWLSGGK
ncbi:DUF6527 family protein [Brevundimonas sp.]|uniref:DUF6527 family protein n=1 Tax=Brevundimonas sp. TaxID=1871086 RepID=UPI0039C89EE3